MWPNPQETAGLITFAEENFNGKIHFLCTEITTFINHADLITFTEEILNGKLHFLCCEITTCINQE